MKIVIFILLFQSFFSWADDCEEIRLDKNNGVMEKIPTFDQGGYGICYAAAATQLYDAYRLKENPSLSTSSSPYHAAIRYALKWANDWDKGGYHDELLNEMVATGSCDGKYIESKFNIDDLAETIDGIMALKEGYDNSSLIKQATNFSPATPAPYHGPEWLSSNHTDLYNKINAQIYKAKKLHQEGSACLQTELTGLGVDAQEIRQMQSLLVSGEVDKFRKELQKVSCPDKQLLTLKGRPKVVTADTSNINIIQKISDDCYKGFGKMTEEQKQQLIDKCDERVRTYEKSPAATDHQFEVGKQWVAEKLKKNGLPIVIGYCVEVALSEFMNSRSKTCSPHASVITGRKKNPKTGACQVLIRNSWGKHSNRIYNKHVQAEGESFWIDEETIYRSSSLKLDTLE